MRYTHPGIQKRVKHQRVDKCLFGANVGEVFDNCKTGGFRGVPAGATVKQVGVGEGYQGYSANPQPVYYMEVTLANGTVVPAYSFDPAEGRNGDHTQGYMICQSYAYKAFVPSKKV